MLATSPLLLAEVFPWGLVSLAIIFFVIAVVAYVFGARGVAGMSAGIGRTLMMVFLALFVIILLFSFLNRNVG